MTGALVIALAFPLIGAAVRRFAGGGPRFLYGVGTAGLVLYATMLLRIPPAAVLIALVLGAVAVLLLVPARETREPVPASAAATVVTTAPLVFLLFVSAVVPLRDYDGRAFWVLKAKAIALERQVDGPFFEGRRVHNPKNEYPLLIPAVAAAVMITTSDIDDIHIRWLYVLALGSFALYARRFVGPWPAALIPWIPQFAIAGEGSALSAYNDIFLAAFAGCAFFELIGHGSPLRFGLWISFLALTKNEGLPFALVLLAAAGIVWRRQVSVALAPFAIAVTTLFVWRSRVEPTDDDPLLRLLPTLPDNLDRLVPAMTAFIRHAFDLQRWGFFWIAAVAAAAVLVFRREWRHLALPVAIIITMSAAYTAAYMVTIWPMTDHIKVSAARLLMHFAAPALYLIGSAVRPRLE